MPLQVYTFDHLRTASGLCRRLRGCRWILLHDTGNLTTGYMISYLPDMGHLMLRDDASDGQEDRVIPSLERFRRVLVDEEDRIFPLH